MRLLERLGIARTRRVHWGRCKDVGWCYLLMVDTGSPEFDGRGVYVVWSGGTRPVPGNTVAVGHGSIREELERLKNDRDVLKRRDLFFTSARLPDRLQPGAHSHLARILRPALGGPAPDAKPVRINPPE